ncbi:MAG: biopolymer transporter ExbD [Gammaproteobacteria bacterium]|nr:biopolymer transporter ExbD [Gammaproteobacteria bacterium]
MLRTKRDNDLDINITPLIDVVFLLLIFFMVSTTFQRESEITIELPESSGDIAESDKKVIEISIDNEGRYFINQRRIKDTDIKTLKNAISIIRADAKEPKLIISADKMTPHQSVVRAMDAARQLGLVHLTFATKQVNKN